MKVEMSQYQFFLKSIRYRYFLPEMKV